MDKKQDVYLLVHHEIHQSYMNDGRDTGVFAVTFVYLSDETGKPRNFSDSSWDIEAQKDDLNYLRISAQYNTSEHTPQEAYGWSVEYHDSLSIDLRRANSMIKTLRKIDRKLKAFSKKWGDPSSFADYVIRVANALGAKAIMSRDKYTASSNGWSYDSMDYREWPVNEAKYALEYSTDKDLTKVKSF